MSQRREWYFPGERLWQLERHQIISCAGICRVGTSPTPTQPLPKAANETLPQACERLRQELW